MEPNLMPMPEDKVLYVERSYPFEEERVLRTMPEVEEWISNELIRSALANEIFPREETFADQVARFEPLVRSAIARFRAELITVGIVQAIWNCGAAPEDWRWYLVDVVDLPEDEIGLEIQGYEIEVSLPVAFRVLVTLPSEPAFCEVLEVNCITEEAACAAAVKRVVHSARVFNSAGPPSLPGLSGIEEKRCEDPHAFEAVAATVGN